jgi:hypothetical protein
MAQTIRVLGIDIAKLVFHVVGMDDTGHVAHSTGFSGNILTAPSLP